MAAVLKLFSNPGVLPGPLEAPVDLHAGAVVSICRDSLITRLSPPDPLPPRA
jgi:hypothetical protein